MSINSGIVRTHSTSTPSATSTALKRARHDAPPSSLLGESSHGSVARSRNGDDSGDDSGDGDGDSGISDDSCAKLRCGSRQSVARGCDSRSLHTLQFPRTSASGSLSAESPLVDKGEERAAGAVEVVAVVVVGSPVYTAVLAAEFTADAECGGPGPSIRSLLGSMILAATRKTCPSST
eukprot:596430-Pleurochrysis_carterae.AAC.1